MEFNLTKAGWLLLPTFAWVGFATAPKLALLQLNSGLLYFPLPF